jgi:tripartite-type tricarboxylate transporter receptor subunit TctC
MTALTTAVAAAALASLVSLDALAQAWPTRAITLVNPVAAGGSNEQLKSIIVDRVAAALGVPIVMESRSGAGGTIGAAYVAKAAPDGYTFLLAGASVMVTNPVVRKDLPYDPLRDFTPVATLIETAPLLIVPKAVPATNAREFVELARAQPGKLNYGSYGRGTSNFLAFELLKRSAGIDVVNIPYKGSAPLLTALRAGEVQAALEYPPTIMPFLADGTFRILGLAGRQRSPLFPDVPTLGEQGYAAATGGYIMVVAPAGVPAAIADRFNAEINKVLALPDVRRRILDIGYEPAGGTRDEATAWIRAEMDRWRRVLADIGYVPD